MTDNKNVRAVHKIIMELLTTLKNICDENNLAFWLEYGTLLGAIRHKGFIPWDNEADVGMLRADFEIFKEIVIQKLPDHIFFQNKDTDPYYFAASANVEAKLRDRYSVYSHFASQNPTVKWHNGIQLDIFVYDAVVLDGIQCFINSFERNLTQCKSYFLPSELEFTIDVPFEKMLFPIPVGFDPYLKRNYHNYLELPAIGRRIFQEVRIFKRPKK